MNVKPKTLLAIAVSLVAAAGLATPFTALAESAATLDAKAAKNLISDRIWQQKNPHGPGLKYWSWKSDGSVCLRTDDKTGKCADTGHWKLDGVRLCYDVAWAG